MQIRWFRQYRCMMSHLSAPVTPQYIAYLSSPNDAWIQFSLYDCMPFIKRVIQNRIFLWKASLVIAFSTPALLQRDWHSSILFMIQDRCKLFFILNEHLWADTNNKKARTSTDCTRRATDLSAKFMSNFSVFFSLFIRTAQNASTEDVICPWNSTDSSNSTDWIATCNNSTRCCIVCKFDFAPRTVLCFILSWKPLAIYQKRNPWSDNNFSRMKSVKQGCGN